MKRSVKIKRSKSVDGNSSEPKISKLIDHVPWSQDDGLQNKQWSFYPLQESNQNQKRSTSNHDISDTNIFSNDFRDIIFCEQAERGGGLYHRSKKQSDLNVRTELSQLFNNIESLGGSSQAADNLDETYLTFLDRLNERADAKRNLMMSQNQKSNEEELDQSYLTFANQLLNPQEIKDDPEIKEEVKVRLDEKEIKESKRNNNDRHHNSSGRSHHSNSKYKCSSCRRKEKVKLLNRSIQCDLISSRKSSKSSSSHHYQPNKNTLLMEGQISHIDKLKYSKYIHIETHSNGGAQVIHMYQNEIDSLSKSQMEELTKEFFQIAFQEDQNDHAKYVMSIVHGAASYLPDLLEHMAAYYPNLTVKSGVLGRSSDIETCTLGQYNEQVRKHYDKGTVRYGPLHQLSLVGVAHEEVGGYFPDLLDRLQENPFLNAVSIKQIQPVTKPYRIKFSYRLCHGVVYL